MKIEKKAFPLELKAVEENGTFSGYLSVFGVMDSYRDIVMPGAFADSLGKWKAKDRLPPMLWQHRSGEPIGRFVKMAEDGKGLLVEGELLINDIARAKEAYALMKAKVVSGMSIGFETIGEEIDKVARARKLTKIDLWEGSIVTFPANEDAQIESIKSALLGGSLPSLPEFESFLREAGFSKSQATAIAGKGLAHLHRSESGQAASDTNLADILAAIKSL